MEIAISVKCLKQLCALEGSLIKLRGMMTTCCDHAVGSCRQEPGNMELPGDMATAPNSLHVLARSTPSPSCLASATRGHHLKTWHCCFHSLQVDLRWHSPLPAPTGMSFLQKVQSLAAEGATACKNHRAREKESCHGPSTALKLTWQCRVSLLQAPFLLPRFSPTVLLTVFLTPR